MAKKLSYWIKERHNPQFKSAYYVMCGQLTVKEAKEHESGTLYGGNYMHRYPDEDSYLSAAQRLRDEGKRVTS